MKLIIFFHAAARKTIINCLVTTQHRPTPYEVELHSAPKSIQNAATSYPPGAYAMDPSQNQFKMRRDRQQYPKENSIQLMLFSFA